MWRCPRTGGHSSFNVSACHQRAIAGVHIPMRVAFQNGPKHVANELFHLSAADSRDLGKNLGFGDDFHEADNENISLTVLARGVHGVGLYFTQRS